VQEVKQYFSPDRSGWKESQSRYCGRGEAQQSNWRQGMEYYTNWPLELSDVAFLPHSKEFTMLWLLPIIKIQYQNIPLFSLAYIQSKFSKLTA